MEKLEITHEFFLELCEDIQLKYKAIYHISAHDYYRVFFIDGIECFRLVFDKKKDKNVIYLAFHINMDNTESIRWYIRIANLADIILVESYYLDAEGHSKFGEEAYELRAEAIRAEVLKDYAEGVTKQLDAINMDKTSAIGNEETLVKALAEFKDIAKPPKGSVH